jgi:hypothetical protein
MIKLFRNLPSISLDGKGQALLIRFLEKKASDVKMSSDCLFLIYNYFFGGSFPQFFKEGKKDYIKLHYAKMKSMPQILSIK